MTSAEFKNAYYALLKNGYSFNLKEWYLLSFNAFHNTQNKLSDITVNYMMFYLLYFALGVLPISIMIMLGIDWVLKLHFHNNLQLLYGVSIGVAHIWTLYYSLKAHIALLPTDNWNGKLYPKNTLWLLTGIVCISLLYGISYTALIYSGLKIRESGHFFEVKYAILMLVSIYILVSTRLALPIMLYSKTHIGEAIFLSVGVVTRKFFHFLLIEISYILIIFLGAALILLGLIFSLEYIKASRSLLVHHLVKNDEEIVAVSEEIKELIEQIGNEPQE